MNKEYLIKKWLKDDLTEEEQKAFQQLDDHNTHLRIIEGAQNFKASEVSEVADLDTFYSRVKNQKDISNTKKVRFTPFLRFAAVLVVTLGIGSLFFLDSNTNIETQISQKTTLELPDTSEVILNAKSQLTFNKRNWDNKREVTLNGEAFFKVAKGSTFEVHTDIGKVSVLGTQFNIKNRKGYFEVKCFEGLVNVRYNEFVKNLPAGSTFTVVNGVATLSENNFDKQPTWLTDVSSFKSVPFYQVIEEFERQYNVTFSEKNIDTTRMFTGGFVHSSLEDGLKSITLPLDLKYTIDSENRITLYKNKR